MFTVHSTISKISIQVWIPKQHTPQLTFTTWTSHSTLMAAAGRHPGMHLMTLEQMTTDVTWNSTFFSNATLNYQQNVYTTQHFWTAAAVITDMLGNLEWVLPTGCITILYTGTYTLATSHPWFNSQNRLSHEVGVTRCLTSSQDMQKWGRILAF